MLFCTLINFEKNWTYYVIENQNTYQVMYGLLVERLKVYLLLYVWCRLPNKTLNTLWNELFRQPISIRIQIKEKKTYFCNNLYHVGSFW